MRTDYKRMGMSYFTQIQIDRSPDLERLISQAFKLRGAFHERLKVKNTLLTFI